MSRARNIGRLGIRAEDGRRSSVWKVWISDSVYKGERTSDVYLAVRELAAHAKISLHGSGQCQFSFVSNRPPVRFLGEPVPPTRHIMRWTCRRRADAALAARIIIPSSELRPLPKITKPVTWYPAPPPGEYAEFLVWFTTGERDPATQPLAAIGQQLVVSAALIGERLLVLYRVRPEKPEHTVGIRDGRQQVKAALDGRLPADDPTLRGFTWFREPQDDGSHVFVEIAFDNNSPGGTDILT